MAILSKKRTILLIAALLIIALYLVAKAYKQRHLASGISPAITGTTLSGKAVSLDNYRSKPVLVIFWASWCSVCKREQDNIQSVSNDHPVISIAMKSGNKQEVATYMQEHKLSFPTIIDENGELARQFGVYALPTSFIVAPGKKIKFKGVGYTTEIGLRARLWLAGF